MKSEAFSKSVAAKLQYYVYRLIDRHCLPDSLRKRGAANPIRYV